MGIDAVDVLRYRPVNKRWFGNFKVVGVFMIQGPKVLLIGIKPV